ncbi:MAG: hypothetical protein JO149_03385 [Gammaproteobacteria bacterium]|nr:hypothetical protein [Gammaproteobacteria bacterium]
MFIYEMFAMVKPTTPTKTCSNCGQQKPLTAFLQLTAAEGRGYGNICATCRKTTEGSTATEQDDKSDSSKTGHRIDAKAKVQGAKDKREFLKEKLQEYQDTREKNELNQSAKWQKILDSAQDLKKQRQRQVSSFLNSPKKPASSETSIVGGEKRAAEEARIDFTRLVDTEIPGKEKYKTALFNTFRTQFKLWLGNDNAPIARSADQNKPIEETAEEKESAADLAKRTWGKK